MDIEQTQNDGQRSHKFFLKKLFENPNVVTNYLNRAKFMGNLTIGSHDF